MRTIRFRALSTVALALFTIAGGAVSAQNRSAAVLNALEVRQLVARAEPAAHARLRAHFSALADRYTAEARRHTSMSQGFVGNPSRSLTTGLSTHCRRLAELNSKAATTVRELATHHERLAAGTPSTKPADGARFEGGAGATAPTDNELSVLAANARTPADHRTLEAYFLTLAKRYTADCDEHAAMARAYRRNTSRRLGADPAAHCDRLMKLSRNAANEATAAATMHRKLAGTAR